MTNRQPPPLPIKGETIQKGVESGIRWETREGPHGTVNGYAFIPDGHPWREHCGEYHLDLPYDEAPDVHGGITYAHTGSGWIGFDTAHAGDAVPGLPHNFPGDHLWTADEVAEETRRLARQIAAATREPAQTPNDETEER